MEEMKLLKKVSHDGFKEFVKEEIAKKGFYRRAYSIVLIVTGFSFFGCAGYGIGFAIFSKQLNYLIQLGAGVLFCFSILIILHELLHGIAYKMAGANKVYFGAILSKFMFYAGSDEEEFNGVQFRLIAIFPFLFILLSGLVCLVIFPQYFLFILTVLFMHTIFCSGDFAVLNFMQQYDPKNFYTSDSKEKRETYFYTK